MSAFCSVERLRIERSIFPLLLVLVCLSAAGVGQKAPPAKPFERFPGCVLEPDEWTDGDSFRVQLTDGRFETFRLYFVDTTESRSRGKRSDEQAAYFGLTRAQAIDLGRQAKIFTANALAQNCGCISSTDHKGRQFWVVAAEREDAGRFIVHADQELPAFLELESAIRGELV